VVGFLLMAAIFLLAQRERVTSPVAGYAPLEVRWVFPREVSPGK
jgi:hypothetical protein